MAETKNVKILRGQAAVNVARKEEGRRVLEITEKSEFVAVAVDGKDFGPPETHQHGDTIVFRYQRNQGVDHAIRLDAIWRMVDRGVIEQKHGKAADKFCLHFERAKLVENFQTISMFRITGGLGDFTDDQMFHREQVIRALDWLGKGMERSLIKHVAGERKSISRWCSARTPPMHHQVAAGILLAGLDRLAQGYGIDY